MRANLKGILVILSCIGFSACSPVKGYIGPDRPDSEIALITTTTEGNLSFTSERIAGIELGFSGITVLPGSQKFEGRLALEGEVYNCKPYTEFDSYGMYDCEEDRRKENKYNNCDCFDYLTVHEVCDQVIKEGNCTATFNTTAGGRYEIRAGLNAGAPAIVVRDLTTLKDIQYGKCEKDNQKTTTVDRYVGSGRSAANRAGFYSCRGY